MSNNNSFCNSVKSSCLDTALKNKVLEETNCKAEEERINKRRTEFMSYLITYKVEIENADSFKDEYAGGRQSLVDFIKDKTNKNVFNENNVSGDGKNDFLGKNDAKINQSVNNIVSSIKKYFNTINFTKGYEFKIRSYLYKLTLTQLTDLENLDNYIHFLIGSMLLSRNLNIDFENKWNIDVDNVDSKDYKLFYEELKKNKTKQDILCKPFIEYYEKIQKKDDGIQQIIDGYDDEIRVEETKQAKGAIANSKLISDLKKKIQDLTDTLSTEIVRKKLMVHNPIENEEQCNEALKLEENGDEDLKNYINENCALIKYDLKSKYIATVKNYGKLATRFLIRQMKNDATRRTQEGGTTRRRRKKNRRHRDTRHRDTRHRQRK